MPRRAASPCPRQGCPGLMRDGKCDTCGGGRYQRARDNRPPAHKRGYDATWAKLRRMVLAGEPLCRECKRQGRIEAATEVHHIKPLADGGEDKNTFENLMPVCRSCHARLEAKVRREQAG